MKQYIVDAFTDEIFSGNPAAVCVMDSWLGENLMMNIARENNFSETAFVVRAEEKYRLRWFTPGGEIDLCGHATLASAYVVMRFYDDADTVTFSTMSGDLTVMRHDDLYAMDFPAYDLKPVPVTENMTAAIGTEPVCAYIGRDLLCVLADEGGVRRCVPDMDKVKELDGLLLHITARGNGGADCVSRSFAPKLGVTEDPVCGSGHCHIVPYWAGVLGRNDITAYQASERGGWLYCVNDGGRVIISGKAALFSEGEIFAGRQC
ncbi:MAG: PhzF family phenazine biosynthesis protein [Synergistaceae bacterium]|nr:PhzF family phenazine biosynthesis protein [Synergistaceae bacterium]